MKQRQHPMNATDFRKELGKLMPGYKWTVHKPSLFKKGDGYEYLRATGVKSSGFNRTSTMMVERMSERYEVKYAGSGTRAPWLHTAEGGTLTRALRSLQDHCAHMGREYTNAALTLEYARKAKEVRE